MLKDQRIPKTLAGQEMRPKVRYYVELSAEEGIGTHKALSNDRRVEPRDALMHQSEESHDLSTFRLENQ